MSNESAIAETRARLQEGACLKQEDIELMLEDFLTPQDIHLLEQHLSNCENCRVKFEQVYGNSGWWAPVRNHLDTKFNTLPIDEHYADLQTQLLKLLKPSDDPSMIGRIGPYEISGIVGQGGMGAVFKGFDASLNRYVAIKMLMPHLSNSGAARKRFAREAQAAAAVVHDNVLPIYGVDQSDGSPYIVMQYSRGKSLHKRVQEQGPLELAEVLRIGIQIARGLAAAHAQGLVHRDVKPANILLDGSVERVKLTDFGLARAVDDATLTRSGTITGTPQYMSPEQARGGAINFQSDLFSMGSVLYTLCTGRPPFRAENSFGILRQITDEEPTPIRNINLNIPDWMCAIVQKLMSKQPQHRYDSADNVADLMEQALAHVQSPNIVPLPEQLHVPSKRPALASWAAAMLAVLAIIFSVGLWQILHTQPKKEIGLAIAPVAEVSKEEVKPGQTETHVKNEIEVPKVEAEKVPDDWYCPDPYPERTWYRDQNRMTLDLAAYRDVQQELELSQSQIDQIALLGIDAIPSDPSSLEFKKHTGVTSSTMPKLKGILTPNQNDRLQQLVFQREGLYAFNFLNGKLKISSSQGRLIDKALDRNPGRREEFGKELDETFKSTFAQGEPSTSDLLGLFQAAKSYRQKIDNSRRQAWNDVYTLLNDTQRAEVRRMRGTAPRAPRKSIRVSDSPVDGAGELFLGNVDMSRVPSKWLLNDPFPQLPLLVGDPDFVVTRLRLSASGLVDRELNLSDEQRQAIAALGIKEIRPTYYQEARDDVTMAEYKLENILTAEQLKRLRQLAVRHFDLHAVETIRVLATSENSADHFAEDRERHSNITKYFEYIQYLRAQFLDYLQTEIEGKEPVKIDRAAILAKKKELDASISDTHQRMWGYVCLSMTSEQRYAFEKAIGPELGVQTVKVMGATVPQDWCLLDPYPQRLSYQGKRMYADLATFKDAQQELGLSETQISQIADLSIDKLPKRLPERGEANAEFQKVFTSLDAILTPAQSERLNQIVKQRLGLDGVTFDLLAGSGIDNSKLRDARHNIDSRRGVLRNEWKKSVIEAFAHGDPEPKALIKLVQAGKTYRQEADDSRKKVWNEVYQLLTNDQRVDYDNRRGPPPKNARADLDCVLFSPDEMNAETPSFDVDLSKVPSDCVIANPYPQLPVLRYDLKTAINRMQLAASGLADDELQLSGDQRDSIKQLNIGSLQKPQSKDLPQEWADAEAKFEPILTASQHERLKQLDLRRLDLESLHVIGDFQTNLRLDRERYLVICDHHNAFTRFQRQTDYQFYVFLRTEVDGKDASAIDRQKIVAKKKELDERVADAHGRTWGKIYLAMTLQQREEFEKAVGPQPEAELEMALRNSVPDGWYCPDPYPQQTRSGQPNINFDLVSMPEVQRELKLNESQIGQIKELPEATRKKLEAIDVQNANQREAIRVEMLEAIFTPDQRERLNQIVFQRLGLAAISSSNEVLKISATQAKSIGEAKRKSSQRLMSLRKGFETTFKSKYAAGASDIAGLIQLYEVGKKYHQNVDDARRRAWNEVYLVLTDAQRAEVLKRRGPLVREKSPDHLIAYSLDAADFPKQLRGVDMSRVPSRWLLNDPFPQLSVPERDRDFFLTRFQLLASGLINGELKLTQEQRATIPQIPENIDLFSTRTQEPPEEVKLAEAKLGEVLTPEQLNRLRQLAVRHADLLVIRDSELVFGLHSNLGQLKDYKLVPYLQYVRFVQSQFFDFLQEEIEGKEAAAIDREKILAKKREVDATLEDIHQRMWGEICLEMTPDQRWAFEKAIGPPLGAPPEEMMSASVPEDWYQLDPYPVQPLYNSYLELAATADAQQELGLNASQVSQLSKLSIKEMLKIVSLRFQSREEIDKLTGLVDDILTPDQSERLHQLNTQRLELGGLRSNRFELSKAEDKSIGDAIGNNRTQRQSLLTEFNKSLHGTFANNNPDAEALVKLYQVGKRSLQQADDSRKQTWNEIYQTLNNSQRVDYAKMRGAAPKNARPNYDTILFSSVGANAEPPAADVDLSAVPSNCLIADPYPQLPVVRFDLTTIVTRMKLAASGLADGELNLSDDQRQAIAALGIGSLPELQSQGLPQEWVNAEAKFTPILTAVQNDRLRQLALRHLDLFAIMNWETFFGDKLKLEWEQTQDIRQCYFDLEKFQSYSDYQFFVFLRNEVDGKDVSAIDREKILAKKKELDDQVAEAHRRTWGKIYLTMNADQRRAFEEAVGPEPGTKSAKGVTEAAPEGWYRPDPYPQRASYEPRRMYLDLATFKDVQQELGLSDSQIEQIQKLSIEKLPKETVGRNVSLDNTVPLLDKILTPDQSTRLNQIVVQRLGLSAFRYSYKELGLSGIQTNAVMNLPSTDPTIRGAMRNELSESVKTTFDRGTPELDALVKLVQARKRYQEKLAGLRKQSWDEVYQWLTEPQRLEYERMRGDVPKNASPVTDSVIYVESEMEELSPLPDVDLSEVPIERLAHDPYPQLPLFRQDHNATVTRIQLAASGLVDAELKLSEQQRTAIQALNIGSLPALTSTDLPREWLMTEIKFMPILNQAQNDRLRQLAFRRHLKSLDWRTYYPGQLNLDHQAISLLATDYSKLQRQAEFQLIAYIEKEIEGKDSGSVDREKIVAKKKELDDLVAEAHRRIWAKIYLTMNADQRRAFEEAIGPDVGQNK